MAVLGKSDLVSVLIIGSFLLAGCDKSEKEIKRTQNDVPVEKPFVLSTIETVRFTADETFDKPSVRIQGSNVTSGAKFSLENIITDTNRKITGDYITTRTERFPQCEFKYMTKVLADELKVDMSIPKFTEAYDRMLSVDGDCLAMERFMSEIETLSVKDDDYRLFAVALEKLYTKESVLRTFTDIEKTANVENGDFSLSFVLNSYPTARPTTAVFHLHANNKITPLVFGLNSKGLWEGEEPWEVYSNTTHTAAPPDKTFVLAQKQEEERNRLRQIEVRAAEEKRRIALERVRYIKENSDTLLLEILSAWDGSKGNVDNNHVEKGLAELIQIGDPAALFIGRTIFLLHPTTFENLKPLIAKAPEDILNIQTKLEQLSDAGKLSATIALALLHQSKLYPSIDSDDNKCISLLTRAKEKNVAAASYFIAEILRNKSQRTETDLRYCMDMFKESASAGSAVALYKLGHIAETEGKNIEQALQYYQAAADKNCGLSQLRSAQLLLKINPQDKTTITNLLERASRNNVMEAFYHLGEPLTKSSLPGDRMKGWEFLEKAAEKGVKPAALAVAVNWIENRKTANYAKALQYVSESAAEKNSTGVLTLGKIHLYALGVPSNVNLGVNLIEDAANLGNGEAMYILYDLYVNGKGIKQNPTLGFQWLSKSARTGYPYAIEVAKAKKVEF